MPARLTHAGQLTGRLYNKIKHNYGEAGMHLHNRIHFGILLARHQTLLHSSFRGTNGARHPQKKFRDGQLSHCFWPKYAPTIYTILQAVQI